jgi:hypothetical protein
MSLSSISRKNSSMTSTAISSRMIILNSLSSQDRRILENQTLRRLQRTSRDDNFRTVEFENEKLIIDQIIKYLHSIVRFSIAETTERFEMKESSTKLIKSTSNSIITRIFVEIVKNSASNKM